MPQIIQFFHPGVQPEANNYAELKKDPMKTNGEFPWNCLDHKRKFLRSNGSALDVDSKLIHGEFAFWGEWEANAKFERSFAKGDKGIQPQYVFRPFLNENDIANPQCRQNTDPIVFGDSWFYSNCKMSKVLGALRHLGKTEIENGSIIVFGSQKYHQFLIDTIFVVEQAIQLTKDNVSEFALLNDITLSKIRFENGTIY